MINESVLLQSILVDSVSCENAKLHDFLEENVETVWCATAATCHPEVHYLSAQLALIEMAQGFTRNQIDISKSRSSANGENVSTSLSYRDSQAQRTNQNTSCNFSKATSFQQFIRDAESRMRSSSDMVADSTGDNCVHGYDRGTTAASGWANSFSKTLQTTNGDSTVAGATTASTSSRSESLTNGPGTPPSDVDGVQAPGLTLTPPFFTGGNANDGYANPGVQDVLCPAIDDEEITAAYQNYGRGWSTTLDVSIGIANLGGIRITLQQGGNFRQSHTVAIGFADSENASRTKGDSRDQAATRVEGASQSHDESATQNDAHSVGDSRRDSQSNTTAASSTDAVSHSETQSGSDRTAHNESQSSGQGTSHSRSHSESESRGNSRSLATAESRAWSQIFRSLEDMWKRVFQEIKEAEWQHMASIGMVMGAMTTKHMQARCNPYASHVDKIKRQPCPPYRNQLPERPTWGGGLVRIS